MYIENLKFSVPLISCPGNKFIFNAMMAPGSKFNRVYRSRPICTVKHSLGMGVSEDIEQRMSPRSLIDCPFLRGSGVLLPMRWNYQPVRAETESARLTTGAS